MSRIRDRRTRAEEFAGKSEAELVCVYKSSSSKSDRDLAATQLIDRFYRSGMASALRLLGNVQDAEDVVSEAFIRTIEKFVESDRASFYGLLHTSIYRDSMSLWRKRGRDRERDQKYTITSGNASSDAFLDRVIQQEEANRLHQALLQLDETDREIISLYWFGGMSFREISQLEHINLAHGALRTRASRAYKELRRLCTEEE